MAKHRIRITGAGIHGQPTAENPTGEFPIGHEFDTDADLPKGWVGRAEIVGEKPTPDATFVVAEDDGTEIGRARHEIGKQALARIEQETAALHGSLQTATTRAERAEADLQKANEQIEVLNLKIAAFERGDDGAHRTGASGDAATADEIKSAVALLDGKTAAHWTTTGLPAVDAIAELTGKTVTRKAIDEAAPGTKRPA